MLSQINPDPDVATSFLEKANELDPLQHRSLMLHLYDVFIDDVQDLFSREVEQYLSGTELFTWVEQLPEFSHGTWADSFAEDVLHHMLGPWGRKNGPVLKLYATDWRREWIISWCCRRLIQEDVASNSRDRFLSVHHFNPILALVLLYVETKKVKHYRQTQVDYESSVIANLYLMRFAVTDQHINRASKMVRDFIVKQTQNTLDESQQSAVWIEKVLGGRMTLMPSLIHPNPIAYCRGVLNNIAKDIVSRRGEQFESLSYAIQDDDGNPVDLVETKAHPSAHQQLSLFNKEDENIRLNRCLNPKQRIVHLLWNLRDLYPWPVPQEWYAEFNPRQFTGAEVCQICEEAMESNTDAAVHSALFRLRPRVGQVDTFRHNADQILRVLKQCAGE